MALGPCPFEPPAGQSQEVQHDPAGRGSPYAKPDRLQNSSSTTAKGAEPGIVYSCSVLPAGRALPRNSRNADSSSLPEHPCPGNASKRVPDSDTAATVLVHKGEHIRCLTRETLLQSVLTGRPNACAVGAENMSSGSALPTALAPPALAAGPPAALPPALGAAKGSDTGLLLAAAALTPKGSLPAEDGPLEPDRALKGSAAADGAGAGCRELPKGSAEALPVVLPKRSAPPPAPELLPKGSEALPDMPELPKGSSAPKPEEA